MSDTKQRLLHSAVDLFSRYGYQGSSIRDIVRQLGIKESSFYNHFKKKETVLETIFNEFNENLGRSRIPAADIRKIIEAANPLEEYIDLSFSSIFAPYEDYYQKIWSIVCSEQFRHPKAAQCLIQVQGKLERQNREVFREIFRKEGADVKNLDDLTWVFTSLQIGIISRMVLNRLHGYDKQAFRKKALTKLKELLSVWRK